jgi:hypothetical protein
MQMKTLAQSLMLQGFCKSRDGTPETIVVELWHRLQGHPKIQEIEGIVYYGKDNVKRVYRGPDIPLSLAQRKWN